MADGGGFSAEAPQGGGGVFSDKYECQLWEGSPDFIQAGQFGAAYRCRRIEDQHDFAVKKCIGSVKNFEALQTEVAIMCQLQSEFLMGVQDWFFHRDPEPSARGQFSLYLVMELCEGGDAFDFAFSPEDRLITPLQLQQLMFRVLSGLEYLHARSLIHRDLKLENVLIKEPGNPNTAKLCDFGYTRFYSGHPTTARRGTDAYMAPEQLRMGYDQQVDIWAAGVMLYILATFPHEFPFGFISEPGNPQELMSIYSRIQRREVDLAKIGDEHVRDLVDHLMHMDPAQRPSAQLALTHSMFAQQYPGLEQAPPPGLEELAPPPGLEQPAPAPAPPPGLE